MFLPGYHILCLLLTACLSACSLEITTHDTQVICSQGLSECTMEDATWLLETESVAMEVTNLIPQVKLCCRDECGLCLVIDIEVYVDLDKLVEEGSHSVQGDDDVSDQSKDGKGSVTLCYKTPLTLPTCKKAEFTVNQAALSEQSSAQITIIINNPLVSFESEVLLYTTNKPQIKKEVIVPHQNEVCSLEIHYRIKDCHVPKLISYGINQPLNQVELHFSGSNTSLPSVCIQSETIGSCMPWEGKTVPLHSITPCMCFQVWEKDGGSRSRSCPFSHNRTFQRNIWENISVSVSKGFMNNNNTMLSWKVSAPCKVDGEVWACERIPGPYSCTNIKGFKQRLAAGSWRQDNKGFWETTSEFDQNLTCVMVQINDMEHKMGPFCCDNVDRWRWSLFAVAVMLLVSLTLLITFFFRDFVKKWAWSWRHGGFVKIGKRGHVLVLSPPEDDAVVSSAVCRLGSLLCSNGFSVTVDQWSRTGQLTSGPLPWSHWQLLSTNSQCDRVVLVLTHKALEIAQRWTGQHDNAVNPKCNDNNLPEESSPYSDVFRASLFAIKAYKKQGTASERFVLVKFDSQREPTKISDSELPEVLQGLPLFHFPSQTNAVLSELSVGKTRRRRTRWMWGYSVGSGGYDSEQVIPLHSKPLQHF